MGNEEKITRMSTVIANYQHQVTSVEQRCTDGNKINSLVSGGPAVYMNSVLETSSYDKKKGCKRASLFVAKTGDLSIYEGKSADSGRVLWSTDIKNNIPWYMKLQNTQSKYENF